ncbi:MAG: PAQR family membrane homeostasis protein TrhA [Spirochaetota bacterium]
MKQLPRELAPSQVDFPPGGAVEEILSSLLHAIGAGLSIAGLVALIILTGDDPSPWKYVSFSIYGASQILLFLSSAVLHSFWALPRVRWVFEILDRDFIFVLIAGTYTPFCLVAMRGHLGWVILGIIWGLAIVGIVMKSTVFRESNLIADLLYVPMAWLVVGFYRPLLASVSVDLLIWMIAGGLCYMVGVVFYAWQKLPYSHVVWHLFVLGGSACFFLGFALHLA